MSQVILPTYDVIIEYQVTIGRCSPSASSGVFGRRCFNALRARLRSSKPFDDRVPFNALPTVALPAVALPAVALPAVAVFVLVRSRSRPTRSATRSSRSSFHTLECCHRPVYCPLGPMDAKMCLPPIQSLMRSNPVFTQTRTVMVTHSVAKGLPERSSVVKVKVLGHSVKIFMSKKCKYFTTSGTLNIM